MWLFYSLFVRDLFIIVVGESGEGGGKGVLFELRVEWGIGEVIGEFVVVFIGGIVSDSDMVIVVLVLEFVV